MNKLAELKQLRADLITESANMADIADTENRSLDEKETKRFESIKKDVAKYDAEIKQLEELQAIKKRNAELKGIKHEPKKENRETADYSMLKAVREMTTGTLSGLELEMHQEAINESRASGVTVSGLGIPSAIWQKRAAITTTSGADSLVEEGGAFIEALRNKSRVLQMGAQYISGLVGDVRFPKQTTAGAITWEGETDAAAEAGAAFGGVTMSPSRGSAYTDVSKQFLNQTSFQAEMILRNDLLTAVGIGIDAAAINGSGTGQPKGILNFAALNTVAIGTNGGAPTWATVVQLESAADAANAPDGNAGYLTTPVMRGKLKTTAKDAGSGLFIWGANEVNGYKAMTSNNVPNDLVKGTSSDCHAIIYASDWSQLLIGQWGGIDLVVDPYTLATTGQVRLVINAYLDVKARHEQAFAAIKDARNV